MAELPPLLHTVSFNVTVIQAEPIGKPLPYYETTRNNSRKRIYENVKPCQYYHMEYQLQPRNATYCTDIVTYGIVAKVFTDQDERVIRSWNKDDLVYQGWKHNHKIDVTIDSLLELYNHTMTVRLWNDIDKISPRARYDRPKAFRLPVSMNEPDIITSEPSHFPGVYHGLSVTSVKQARRKSNKPTIELSDYDGESREQSIESLVPSQKSQLKIPPPNWIDVSASSVNNASSGPKINLSSSTISTGLKGISKQRLKQLQDEAIENERINREGIAVLSIKLADLFGDEYKVKVCLKDSSAELKYFEISLSLETPLMSEEQRRILNPMTIIIKDCSLPPVKKNNDRLLHVSYQFLGKPKFKTHNLAYSSKLTWNSSNVILLGTIKPELLLEYFRGPPLKLDIVEKDKNSQVCVVKDALYGHLNHDSQLGICTQSSCTSCGTSQGTCTCTSKWNEMLTPHAKLDMSCFLSGLTMMEFTLPVMSEVSHQYSTVNENYMEHDSQINVVVKLTYPMTYPDIHVSINDNLKHKQLTAFGRMVYIVHSSDMELVNTILDTINEVNATGLSLTDTPLTQRQAVLSTFKLTREQITSPKCDIITGIHIEDSNRHIFMLEGLHCKGLHKLWEELPHQSTHDQNIKYFYDSDYTFSKRLYGAFDVDIVHISLPQPLQCIVPDPKLYLYDTLPKPAFLMLMNLYELQYAQDFSCVIRNDMFPSVDMVNSLNIYCSQQTVSTKGHLEEMPQKPFFDAKNIRKRSRSFEPLNNTNSVYEDLLAERQHMAAKDSIKSNILKIHKLSDRAKNDKKLHQRSISEGGKPVSVYSSQTYNLTIINKAALRKQLGLTRRYTYCQQYHHMTVEPVNASEELKAFWKRSDTNKWMTNEGFTCYGGKTQIQSNAQAKNIHPRRKEDLMQPFTDNILHSNKLKPTVDREIFSWEDRLNDFDRYKPHPIYFGTKYPVTIHLAGESRFKETKLFLDKEAEKWKNKMIVDHLKFNTLRQGIRTELSCRAAFQQDKYQGLLKDEPIIPSGIAPSDNLRVDKIPGLSTIRASEIHAVGYTPGDIELSRSLKLDCNALPIHK